MKKTTGAAAALALAVTMGASAPANATDYLTIKKGIFVLGAAAALINRASRPGLETSRNTQYALTGKGTPVYSNNGVAPGRFGQTRITCNAHGTHCQTLTGQKPAW